MTTIQGKALLLPFAIGLALAASAGAAGWYSYARWSASSDALSPERTVAAFQAAVRAGNVPTAFAYIDEAPLLEALARDLIEVNAELAAEADPGSAAAGLTEADIQASLPSTMKTMRKGLEAGIVGYPKGQSMNSIISAVADIEDPPISEANEKVIAALGEGRVLVLKKRDGRWMIVEFRGFEPLIKELMGAYHKAWGSLGKAQGQ